MQSWARRQNTRLFSQLTGMVTQRPTMLPHKTLLRPVHPFTGKFPIIQTAEKQVSNRLGSPLVSLRKKPTVKEVVTDLSECLRLCHRKNVEWLEPTPSDRIEWLRYAHDYLISPMLQLFRQLRACEVKDDMFSHAEQGDDGIVKVWFTSLDFEAWEDPVYPPAIFITPQPFPSLVNTEAIARAVSPILCHGRFNSESASKAIFTDLKTVLIIHPQAGANEVQVEIVPLNNDLRAFRIIAAAYLLEATPQALYINLPREPTGKYLFWLPPFYYDDKLLTDEEVFRTKHRHSDFNILKLLEDREGALQFFRWKLHVEKHISPKITSTGDILECTTNEFDQRCHPPRGVCSKPIPPPTLQHMENIFRPNPLSSALRSTLKDSKRFTIKLGKALGHSSLEHVTARVHLCHIETIDDHPIQNCPVMVMKIFDDRFMEGPRNPYNEDGVLEDNVNFSAEHWFQRILTAEWHVRGELTAFEKMEMAQGSSIPYFYGAHKFRLANGHEVFGILMEYIDAPTLGSGVMSKWSEEHRGQLMTSIRHGLRVIQCADISQYDWHGGQILCNVSPSQAHAVFIDFSATTQTVDLEVNLSKDDYGLCVSAVQDVTGLDLKWVCEYWGRDEMKRECWDTDGLTVVNKDYVWSSRVVDPYKFVYDGLDQTKFEVGHSRPDIGLGR